jgi:hypothetical protein
MAELKIDSTLAGAVDLAREAAVSIAEPGTVGDHLGVVMEAERLATHRFSCASTAYVGWQWSVSVARSPRQKFATICETSLVPGEGAILAPEWVPYAERIAPGDLGAGDVLPYREDDPLLQQGFEATGDDDTDQLAIAELGLGRVRVLSPQGREAAAQRWYDGAHGPRADVAEKAPAPCQTCGYFLPMAGALRLTFGVCANEWSPSDGKVVSLDHGCGAHSEVDVTPLATIPIGSPIVDEYAVELVPHEATATGDSGGVDSDQPAESDDADSGIGDIAAAAADVEPTDAPEDESSDA